MALWGDRMSGAGVVGALYCPGAFGGGAYESRVVLYTLCGTVLYTFGCAL